MSEQKIYSADNIFTGDRWLQKHALIVESGKIKKIVPAGTVEGVVTKYNTILPAFIDLQIYGAYQKLFSVYPDARTLSLIHSYCKQGGAFYFQPTVATNTTDIIFKCIDAIKDYWKTGGQGCLGLHVEGPWINKQKRGAHIETIVHSPTIKEVKNLLKYGKGVIKMITLAPEVCSSAVIEMIQRYHVVVSAGHSNITFKEAGIAFKSGITTVTHLYNAMSGLQHREPGLVGAAFLNNNVMASIIADGHHVDYAAVKIAKAIMKERLFLITDAVTETTTGPYPHNKENDKYVASGILSGSALTMMQAVKNLISEVGIDKTEAIKMACTYPAKAAQIDNAIGKIECDYNAAFIATDEALSFVEMIN